LAVIAAAAAVVVGCGDDPVTPTSTIVVSDPYATGCTVTVGVATATETATPGIYRVTAALNGSSAVTATGCTDSITGVKLPDLKSDGSASGLVEVVSPVTTMIEALVAGGTSRTDAKTSVAAITGVAQADLEKDPVSNLALQKAASFVTSVVNVLREIVQNAGITGTAQDAVVNSALTALVTTAKNDSTAQTPVTLATVNLGTVLTTATASLTGTNANAATAIQNKAGDLDTARSVIKAQVDSAQDLQGVAKVAKAVNDVIALQVATSTVNSQMLAVDLQTVAAQTQVAAIVVITDPTGVPAATGATGGTGGGS
jgi:hypothetical protein